MSQRLDGLRHARQVLAARRAKTANSPYEGSGDAILAEINRRYTPTHVWSPSRLESYRTCPHQFFVGTALGLEPRLLPALGLDASQLGSILHKILEQVYREGFDAADGAAIDTAVGRVADQVFRTAPDDYGFRPSALWEIEKGQLKASVANTVRKLAEDITWIPFGYELAFGLHGKPPLEIALQGETIRVRGVIDRVDINANGDLRVIDYKTGGSHLDAKDLKDGRRLQLPIYALAARDALKLGQPVEGLYWKILASEAGSLKLSRYKKDELQGFKAAVLEARGHLQAVMQGIRMADFSPRQPQGGCPTYCPAAQWCWRYEAER